MNRRAAALVAAAVIAAFAFAPLASCGTSSGPNGSPDAGPSPNASILPAPLATEAPELIASAMTPSQADAALIDGKLLAADASAPQPPPESLAPGLALPAETPVSKDLTGVTLDAIFRWRDLPPPYKAPEVSAEGLREALKATSLQWKIDLTETGRMRIEFASAALPLVARSEIRARTERYGHLVLWPNATSYRVVPPGALRTLLGEHRVDVTPLSVGATKSQGEGKRLGVTVRKVEVTSSLGSLKMELGKINEAGEGGALLCRALVEIIGVDPKSPACVAGEAPLHAAYSWQEGGGITLEVTALQKRTDLSSNALLMPPPGAAPQKGGLPLPPYGIFLTQAQLAAFRTVASPLQPSKDPSAPGEGIVAANGGDMLMYLLVDGVPAVAVPPGAERYLIGPQRGKYSLQWRTFLGERVLPPRVVEAPARVTYGVASDAGAPDGG